jgi:exopolysaccharide production protein ExoQ
MHDFIPNSDSTTLHKIPWRLWLTVVVLGGVFFFVDHDLGISRSPQFAPWANSDDIVASGGNVLKGAALSSIGLLGIWFLLDKRGPRLRLRGITLALMFLFMAWAAISASWSIDPPLTVRRVAVLCFYFLGALGIARQLTDRDIAWAALAITTAYLVIGILAEVALGTFRPWASDYRFSGTLHPNYQGLHMMILCLAAFLLVQSSSSTGCRKWLMALFVVGLVFLVLTKSRTSAAGFVLALSVLWFLKTSAFNRMMCLAAGMFAICTMLLICSFLGLSEKDAVSGLMTMGRQDSMDELTGRMPIWNELMHYVNQRPLTGYGYESFWTAENIEDLSDALGWRFRQAHCGYIDMVLSVGLVGGTCALLIVITGIHKAAARFRQKNQICCGLALGMLAFGLVDLLLESGMAGENFATLLAGCGLLKVLCATAESNSHSVAAAVNADNYCTASDLTLTANVGGPVRRTPGTGAERGQSHFC